MYVRVVTFPSSFGNFPDNRFTRRELHQNSVLSGAKINE